MPCPNQCSGTNGACSAGKCTCEPGFLDEDCSQPGTQVSVNEHWFGYSYQKKWTFARFLLAKASARSFENVDALQVKLQSSSVTTLGFYINIEGISRSVVPNHLDSYFNKTLLGNAKFVFVLDKGLLRDDALEGRGVVFGIYNSGFDNAAFSLDLSFISRPSKAQQLINILLAVVYAITGILSLALLAVIATKIAKFYKQSKHARSAPHQPKQPGSSHPLSIEVSVSPNVNLPASNQMQSSNAGDTDMEASLAHHQNGARRTQNTEPETSTPTT